MGFASGGESGEQFGNVKLRMGPMKIPQSDGTSISTPKI